MRFFFLSVYKTQRVCLYMNFTLQGTRDNFKIHVNFMKPQFLCIVRQDEAYNKK